MTWIVSALYKKNGPKISGIPDFLLPAGNYWFEMAIGTCSGPLNGAFVASTFGINGIGSPLGDDQSIYLQSQNNVVSWNYVDSYTVNSLFGVFNDFDPSYYVRGVPELSAGLLLGMASVLLGWSRSRHNRRWTGR